MPTRPALLILLLLAACQGHPIDDARSSGDLPWAAPAIDRDVVVRDGHDGHRLEFDEMIARAAGADVVFLGETHLDETTHRVEHAVYERLIDATGGKVVLAMEMFERDVQPTLDRYLAGEIDEAEFLANARPWSNYRTAYRPLIETAKARGLPVIASNFPAPLRRKLGMGGSVDDLSADERALMPAELFPPTDEYWDQVMNAVRSHRDMMGGSDPESRLYAGQNLWDNSMGESCAIALDRYPGHVVLHVNGGFHSARWDGTVRQLQLRRDDADVLTVDIEPSTNPLAAGVSKPATADFEVFATDRASDINSGSYSVRVGAEMSYTLHVPKWADDARPAPLLIWLPDEGISADEAMAVWKGRVGEHAAVAVIEPPLRERQEDLSIGGLWFFPESFRTGVFTATGGVERAWGYMMRNLPLDGDRVVVGGEGVGATVATALAVYTPEIGAEAVAWSPRRHRELRDLSLPIGRTHKARSNRLQVWTPTGDAEWWDQELGEYRSVGLSAAHKTIPEDTWKAPGAAVNAVLAALGAPSGPAPSGTRAHIVAPVESPLCRAWCERLADRERRDGVEVAVLSPTDAPNFGGSRAISVAVRAADFADGHRLPRAPGPFGGTTVVVVPSDAAPGELDAWVKLEQDDVMSAFSRFHRLRVATLGGERDLAGMMAKLLSEGRRNVLVVPAEFCADGATMRDLRDRTRALADEMTLHFLPGLGGKLAAAAPSS